MSNPLLAREAERATEIDRLAVDSLGWAQTGAPQAHESLPRDLRRDARRAKGLRNAAQRPVAVAVFGASQAGKSYLVSRLAAPLGKPLTALIGTQRLDFLKDINPPGGNESTGLVTRFTIAPPPAPADAPIALRLLTQTDVVKILANTYLEDFALDEGAVPQPEDLQKHLAQFEGAAGPAPCDGLDVDGIEDLQDYLRNHFRDRTLIGALSNSFWQRFADIVPRLPAERRAEAFSILWGRDQTLTKACTELLTVLKRLGFPEDVRAGMDAVQPRETSVVDVRTLFTMGQPSPGTVALRPASGGAGVPVDRALATALITEIVVPLAEKPWAFFDHTDLLDFPGARVREEIPNAEKFFATPGNLGRAFLRGKVAYLFQRYNAEQEISAMLLCVGPQVQEVQTLPKMVDDWIGLTAGKTPAERAGKASNLFFVLTKFDAEFEEKGGEDIASGHRWTARMQASLVDFFGKAYEWPDEWVPGQPFTNTFWLRNPSVGFDAVFDYEPDPEGGRREVGVSPRAAQRVQERREAYLNNPLVKKHFANPAKAWDEALRPNDGGIGHLAAALAPVCDPTLKARQLKARAATLVSSMSGRLRPFFRGGDAEQRVEDARRRARVLGRALAQTAQAQLLGPFLRSLMVDADSIAAVYWRLRADASLSLAPIGAVATKDDYDDLLGDLLGEPEATEDAPATGPRDVFEQFASLALEDWEMRMRALADDEAALAYFPLPREVIAEIAGELAQGARRLKLRDGIAEVLRSRANFQARADAMEQKQVAIVEERINEYVHRLNWPAVEPAKRPKLGRDERPIFLARAPDPAPPPLPEQPSAYDRQYNADWIAGLAGLMEGNARSSDGVDYDIVANARLGQILQGLAASQDAA
ncbi:virulence factor SrfC family protein [Siccirubricoccus phaeus]|uniref:virulence factor SrfC family protein n=1 Tax=Siccirubricoccus phaeus TaxID=2595053 RepID=UPI0011F360EE|nr:virulence factor SrfC family protein [Siccirubricoccus phaeus]